VQNCVLPRIVLTFCVAPNERLASSRRALCLSTLTSKWDTALVVTLYSQGADRVATWPRSKCAARALGRRTPSQNVCVLSGSHPSSRVVVIRLV